MYGRQAEFAVAAMGRLAEVYDGGKTPLTAADIATACGLPRPFVAKTLSVLARAGLVNGSRGPGGGFSLSRDPKLISLHDVFRLFEREDDAGMCPFGWGKCGAGEPCALHHRMTAVQKEMCTLLHKTTFDEFRVVHDARQRQEKSPSRRKTTRKSTRKTKPKVAPRRSPGAK